MKKNKFSLQYLLDNLLKLLKLLHSPQDLKLECLIHVLILEVVLFSHIIFNMEMDFQDNISILPIQLNQIWQLLMFFKRQHKVNSTDFEFDAKMLLVGVHFH